MPVDQCLCDCAGQRRSSCPMLLTAHTSRAKVYRLGCWPGAHRLVVVVQLVQRLPRSHICNATALAQSAMYECMPMQMQMPAVC